MRAPCAWSGLQGGRGTGGRRGSRGADAGGEDRGRRPACALRGAARAAPRTRGRPWRWPPDARTRAARAVSRAGGGARGGPAGVRGGARARAGSRGTRRRATMDLQQQVKNSYTTQKLFNTFQMNTTSVGRKVRPCCGRGRGSGRSGGPSAPHFRGRRADGAARAADEERAVVGVRAGPGRVQRLTRPADSRAPGTAVRRTCPSRATRR